MGGAGRWERRRRRRREEGEEEGEEEGDHNDQILCKKAVTEGLQRRLLTGSSSSIGVGNDCRASAAVQHIDAHSSNLRTPPMGSWASDGSFNILRAARILMEAAVVSDRRMRLEWRSTSP